MIDINSKGVNFIRRVLVALPIASLVLGAIAWLRYGFDMPWFDDWRGYADGTIHSFKLTHLFRPTNSTLSPVGFALDALAQRYLDGNSVAYQFLSMVLLLGMLLVLQWKLLAQALSNRWHVAICFSLTILMLQPGSYWGLENLAYHQGLPLLFILGALYLVVSDHTAPFWRRPAIFLLGLLAGFSYISGAFAALAVSVALLCATPLLQGQARRNLLHDTAWLAAASSMATVAQLYFSVIKGAPSGIPLAWPTELEFWFFYLGKLARSLALPVTWPLASLTVTVLACAAFLSFAVLLVFRARLVASTGHEKRLAVIVCALGAGIFVYLLLVSAGRTKLRPDDMHDTLDIFQLAFTRFHFFWATLLWPWLAAGVISVLNRGPLLGYRSVRWIGISGVFAVAYGLWVAGAYDHMATQGQLASHRRWFANCLLNELQRGGEVRCHGVIPSRPQDAAPDAYPAYLYAKRIGASFVRDFPLLPSGRRRDSILPFYRLDGSNAQLRVHQVQGLGAGAFEATGPDARLHIQTQKPQFTHRCVTMDVEVDIKVTERDIAQLFFLSTDDAIEFGEDKSEVLHIGVEPGLWQTLVFRIDSDTGFFESLRLDPVARPQKFELREVRAYCLRERF